MATQALSAKLLDGSLQEQASESRYVARQPILDLRSNVHGYELLIRDNSSTSLGNAAILGLEQLTCGLPAFVSCSVASLTEDWVHDLPPNLTVVELSDELEPTSALMAACRKLKGMGFRLALDDFTGKPEFQPLVDIADYIKVNFLKLDATERRTLLRRLAGSPGRLLAKHIETQEDYRQACAEGFKLFEGYYFCHPEPIKNHRIPANRLVHLEIMELVQNESVDLQRLSQLVMCDASLTYRLLRLVNSPVCAMRQEVTSIQSALMLVGEKTFRRIAMLAIASDFNTDQPAEILRMAFERGRFCELASGLCGLIPTEQYLIGMVSMFPAMLRIPMGDLARSLPLREKAREALLGAVNAEGILLQWLSCHEHGDWAGCDAIIQANNLRHDQITRCHAEAVAWSNTALNTHA